MKRTRLLSTAALASALLAAAAPAALAQGTGGDAPTAQNRATAEADRLHKNNGLNGGPADLLRLAQGAMRRGQTAQANELLERAETRLLLRDGGATTGETGLRPAGGEPARHVSEARRALLNRDRAEAMRHTNLAIATTGGGGGGDTTGSDAGGRGGVQGGGPGMVDSGMGPIPAGTGRAVVRDGGTGGASVSRAEGVVLAQSSTTGPGGTGTGSGARGGAPRGNAPTGLPPGDTIPGWSGPRGGGFGATGNTAPQSQGTVPQGTPPTVTAPPIGVPSAGGTPTLGTQGLPSGPSSSSLTGGEPARVGGAPPGDTSRAPGSSGISGTGAGNSLR